MSVYARQDQLIWIGAELLVVVVMIILLFLLLCAIQASCGGAVGSRSIVFAFALCVCVCVCLSVCFCARDFNGGAALGCEVAVSVSCVHQHLS